MQRTREKIAKILTIFVGRCSASCAISTTSVTVTSSNQWACRQAHETPIPKPFFSAFFVFFPRYPTVIHRTFTRVVYCFFLFFLFLARYVAQGYCCHNTRAYMRELEYARLPTARKYDTHVLERDSLPPACVEHPHAYLTRIHVCTLCAGCLGTFRCG